MTALVAAPPRSLRSVAIAAGLGLAVWGRWAVTMGSIADPVTIGALFGTALLAVALATGLRPASPRPGAIVRGIAGGLVLVVVATVAHPVSGLPMAPTPVPLVPWAVVTILVATAEEAILRGALFDSLFEAGGVASAIVLTSLVFAVMHVPLYGWHVVPLDLGVGLVLGGLRILSGGIAAPAVAHAIADLVTYRL